MQTSPLQLEGYYIEDLAVSLHPDIQEHVKLELTGIFHPLPVEPNLDPHLSLQIAVKIGQKKDEPRRFRVQLQVSSDNEDSPDFPYLFKISLVGYFNVEEDYPLQNLDLLVNINAPSLLYSAARETLAMITGRTAYPALVLPTVTFTPNPIKKVGKKTTRRKASARLSAKKTT